MLSYDRCSKYARALPAAAMLLLVVGCGHAEYETRLAESKKYYAYLDKIEQNLAPKWVLQGNLMDLRVPKQFALIPAPVPVKKEDGTFEPITSDPRQPDYLPLALPELFGAWEAVFKVTTEGSVEERKGYIYVLSNYWELASERANDAVEFANVLKSILSQQLDQELKPENQRIEAHPKVVPAYVQQQSYDVCTFPGKKIKGANYTFEVYSRTNGSVIGVVLTVLPEGIDSQQKIAERIPMMIESFNFTKTPPKAGTTVSTPGSAATPNTGF